MNQIVKARASVRNHNSMKVHVYATKTKAYREGGGGGEDTIDYVTTALLRKVR